MLAMDRAKLAPEVYMRVLDEVLNSRRQLALTFLGHVRVVGPLSKTTYVFRETDAGLELRVQDVAFVQEQHEVHFGEKFVRANLLP